MRLKALWSTPRRRIATVLGGVLLTAVVGVGAFLGWIWASIEEVDFDPDASRRLLAEDRPSVPADFFDDSTFDDVETTTSTIEAAAEVTSTTVPGPDDEEGEETAEPQPLPIPETSPRGDLAGYLVAGSDGTAALGNADAIYLAVKGSGTVLYTIPRSLYLPNPCTGEPVRAALLLRGCPGAASGPSLLALGMSEFTGVDVRGFAVVSYSGFPQIVDALGGVTICSDTDRGRGGNVIVPAGCNNLDGGSATWWVTSRSQDELVDGEWRAVAGDDEMSRSGRQSVALQAVLSRVTSFSSAGSLAGAARQVPNTFALGGISVTEAAGLALSLRGGYHIASIPSDSQTTADGTWVLLPTESFSATLARNGQ